MRVRELTQASQHKILARVLVLFIVFVNEGLHAQWSDVATENDTIVVKAGNQTNPSVISDGAGGAVIVWQDDDNSSDIYGGRIKSSGRLSRLFDGRIAVIETSNQSSPVMVADGRGGAFVAWQDTRSIISNIFAQKIDVMLGVTLGPPEWPDNGVLVQTGNNYVLPNMIRDGIAGAIIASYTLIDGKSKIDFQKLNNLGEIQWDEFTRVSNNVDVANAIAPPTIISDGNRGVIAVWGDQRENNLRVYAARLNGNGKPAWATIEVPVSLTLTPQTEPAIIPDGAGGVIIAWIEPQEGNASDRIMIQRLNDQGLPQWDALGRSISSTPGAKSNVQIVTVNKDTSLVMWIDLGSGPDRDIRVQRIDSSGEEVEEEFDIVSAFGDQVNPSAIPNKRDGVIVAWEDMRSEQTDIYAQLIAPDGQRRWGTTGLAVTTAPNIQKSPVLVDDGLGGAIIVWEDRRSSQTGSDIYAQRVSAPGVLGEFRNITVVEPDTNIVNWEIGSSQTIRWVFQGEIERVSIELSRDGGRTFQEQDIIFTSEANTGSATWAEVTGPPSDSCKIRISAVNAEFVFDDSDQSFVISSREPPRLQPQIVEQSSVDEPIVVTTTANDNSGVNDVFLHFRKGGDLLFDSVTMIAVGADSFRGTIPTDFVTERGVEYFISGTDNLGISDSTDFFFVTVTFGAGRQQTGVSRGSSQNAYRMVSAPNDLAVTAMDSILSASGFGAIDTTNWRVFIYENGKYVELDSMRRTDPTFSFVPGKAFWLISSQNHTIDFGAGVSLPTNSPYSIEIKPGWNQISVPFAFPVAWQSALDKTDQSADLSPPYLYEGFHEIVGLLEPYKGYFVFNSGTQPINLRIPPIGLSEQNGALKATEVAEAGWEVQIRSSCQQARDIFNFIGIHTEASQYRDALDYPEPPPIGDFISLYFSRPDWPTYANNYTTDYRSEIGAGQIWRLEVDTNIPNSEARMEFLGLESLPPDLEIWLLDEKLNIKRNVQEHDSYAFPTGSYGTTKSLKILIGKSGYISGELSDLAFVPREFELSQNFPNPFNPVTTIRFGLPHSETVRIKVFDLLGREVRSLVNDEHKEAGYHIVSWNGRDDNNLPVASGLYVYRLQAGRFSQTRKMLLVK